MKVKNVFAFVVGFLFSAQRAVGGPWRPKRIIGGEDLFEKDRSVSPLKVLDYYVWMGHSWFCHEDVTPWNRLWRFVSPTLSDTNPLADAILALACPAEDPTHLKCGGALITPKVVQTACHCVVQMVHHGDVWSGFKIRTNEEDRIIVYMGKTEVKDFVIPILSQRFAAHEKCAEIKFAPAYLRFDIGWVILEQEVPQSRGLSRGFWGRLDYAGPYSLNKLNELSNRVLEQRQVCLICGYGLTAEKGRISPTFKFAWVQVLDWEHCYEVTWKSVSSVDPYVKPIVFFSLDTVTPYSESVSWACTYSLPPWRSELPLPTIGGNTNHGDSGSPITCNNNYFAQVSGARYFGIRNPGAGFRNISVQATIYSAPESITIEHRRDFEGRILVGRYNPDNVRLLKFPNGSIHFQSLKYSEKFTNEPPFQRDLLPISSSTRGVLSAIARGIFVFKIFLYLTDLFSFSMFT